MIETKDVVAFFDRLAPGWDAEMVRNEGIISTILDNASVSEGTKVLDVACGTGVLIPDYLKRNVASVTGIDISPKMAELARAKFPQEQVTILCGDVEATAFEDPFDCVVVYNAFPHFPDPDRLIRKLSSLLKTGGTLTVAHGMSRERINDHHRGGASRVSYGLMPAEDLAALFGPFLAVDQVISDESMYLVSGVRP